VGTRWVHGRQAPDALLAKRKVTGSTPVPTTTDGQAKCLVIVRFQPVSVSRREGHESPPRPPNGDPSARVDRATIAA
jgi:hypothetical protein